MIVIVRLWDWDRDNMIVRAGSDMIAGTEII